MEKTEEPEKEVLPVQKELKSDLVFYTKRPKEGIEAKMVVENGEFKVLAGSRYKELKKSGLESTGIKGTRERLIEQGVMKDGIFEKDYLFNSSSGAAAQISGTAMQGPNEWKTEKGVKLAEYLKEQK